MDGLDPGNVRILSCDRINQRNTIQQKVINAKTNYTGKKENDNAMAGGRKCGDDFPRSTQRYESRQASPVKAKEASGVDGLDPGNVRILFCNRSNRVNELDIVHRQAVNAKTDYADAIGKIRPKQTVGSLEMIFHIVRKI